MQNAMARSLEARWGYTSMVPVAPNIASWYGILALINCAVDPLTILFYVFKRLYS